MRIRNIIKNDIGKVARQHLIMLPDGRSAKIGLPYLTKLYLILVDNPGNQINLLMEDNNKILGVVTATADFPAIEKRLKKVLLRPDTIYLLIKSLITGRMKIKQILSYYAVEKSLEKILQKPYFYISTLFVIKGYQRRGIGKKLVGQIINMAKKNSIKRIYLDTLHDNLAAQKFYEKAGFTNIKKVADSLIYKYEFK